jgi:hypothetical protein
MGGDVASHGIDCAGLACGEAESLG